jgi:hypothetical protein
MASIRASVVLVAMLCGCATSTTASTATPGLSNAPKLGTWPSRDRLPYDVVANGRDSCERSPTSKEPVWAHSPPCPPVAEAKAKPELFAPPPTPPTRAWVPKSHWSAPECARGTSSPELASVMCCPAGDAVCAR